MDARKALVTGASDGIGKHFAQALAKDGYQITAVARRADKLKEVVGSLEGAGHRHLVADLSEASAVQQVATDIASGKYDVLVNNAGTGLYGQFEDTPLDKFQQMTRLNIDALVALSHAYLKAAKAGDALINVASTLGWLPLPTASVYCATKAFVISFSESLWYEQKDRGVYVMALCPGATDTGFHLAAGGQEETKPPKNMIQTPEGVVAAAMRGLKVRSDPTVISSFMNGAMVFSSRLMSHKATVNMMGGMLPKKT